MLEESENFVKMLVDVNVKFILKVVVSLLHPVARKFYT